mmetsp:Transcript_6411/g.11092  ORF Transcript_6411/g.11092 Transcript_6411/m.11092 type:complete len:174 (-) Transcript_6411:345-866(-)
MATMLTSGMNICHAGHQRVSLRTNKPQTVRHIGKRVVTTRAMAEGVLPGKPAQLASAKLPKGCDAKVFSDSLYQWAASLTTNGANMPFALPQKVDRTPDGFKLSFLSSNANNEFVSIGDIVAEVEPLEGDENALVVLFYGDYSEKNKKSLVDIPMVMQTMPGAIKTAFAAGMQ